MSLDNYHHGDLKNALIQAGIEILAEEGVGGLSLRKAARRAGVSHAAPYAHFADKQTLIAAIASDGHARIHERIEKVLADHPEDPLRQLVGAAWAYVQFGLEAPAHYKITFSGAIQDEHGHPEFMEISQRNMQVLKAIVERCRAAGIMDSGGMDAELQAVSLWGLIHGLVSLWIQGQLPSHLMQRITPEAMLIAALQQVVKTPIAKDVLA
ncbi:transcriptional regulator, TetR family [Longilinea arvoryzae]|uniref:Transcriptional regulator, TetR family n=1 Tax=Longilinea arvoryzae TaxID=360412 RepID=A0A0S7BEB3_9CHLR|nr:TetR/AcrR family transcriptional regulator [Longilinea arvoryzae]GAP12742.1 transcriptional regulator, TetR family [Longilinea arvoryzae]